MKRKSMIIAAAFMLCLAMFSEIAYAGEPSSWALKEVNEAMELEIVPDSLQGEYTVPIKRAEFCQLIVNMITVKEGKSISEIVAEAGKEIDDVFSDTDDQDILAAYALGIVSGLGDGVFAPDKEIKRQEAAAMLVRTAKILGEVAGTEEELTFADKDKIDSYALESVAAATLVLKDSTNGVALMAGAENNQFSPLGVYTREQAIMTAKRLYNAFSEAAAAVPEVDTAESTSAFPVKFSAVDIYGKTVTEKDLGEKEVLLIHYWATWCPDCVNGMPAFAELIEKYGDKIGFISLLHDYETGKEAAIELLEANNTSFIVVDANHSELEKLKELVYSGYVPTSVFIDKEGKSLSEKIIEGEKSEYLEIIDTILK